MDLFPKDAVARNQPATPGLAEKWRGWINDPVNRAALIQTGLSLLQPVSPGQSVIGHIGQGIGSGLALRGRYDEDKREQMTAAQKRDMEQRELQLRESELAGRNKDRASDAAYRTDALKLQREELEAKKATGGLTLSQILANQRMNANSIERNRDQFASYVAERRANAVLNNEDPNDPAWLETVKQEWLTSQNAAKSMYPDMPIGPEGVPTPDMLRPSPASLLTPENIRATAEMYGMSEDEVRRILTQQSGAK